MGGYWRSNLPRLIDRVKFETRDESWTQERIAKAAGLRQPTVSEWMQTGKEFKRLDAVAVKKLLRFLNVYFHTTPNDLVTFIGENGEELGQQVEVATV